MDVDGGFVFAAMLATGTALALALAIGAIALVAATAVGSSESIGAGITGVSEVMALFELAATLSCCEVAGEPVCKIFARKSGCLYANAPPPKTKPTNRRPPSHAPPLLFLASGGGVSECCGYATAAAPSVALETCEIGSEDPFGASIVAAIGERGGIG